MRIIKHDFMGFKVSNSNVFSTVSFFSTFKLFEAARNDIDFTSVKLEINKGLKLKASQSEFQNPI